MSTIQSLSDPMFTNQWGSKELDNIINHNRSDFVTDRILYFNELIELIENGETIDAGINVVFDGSEWKEVKNQVMETYYHKNTGYYLIIEYDYDCEMWCRLFIKKKNSVDTIWLSDMMDNMFWDLNDNPDTEVEVELFQEYI